MSQLYFYVLTLYITLFASTNPTINQKNHIMIYNDSLSKYSYLLTGYKKGYDKAKEKNTEVSATGFFVRRNKKLLFVITRHTATNRELDPEYTYGLWINKADGGNDIIRLDISEARNLPAFNKGKEPDVYIFDLSSLKEYKIYSIEELIDWENVEYEKDDIGVMFSYHFPEFDPNRNVIKSTFRVKQNKDQNIKAQTFVDTINYVLEITSGKAGPGNNIDICTIKKRTMQIKQFEDKNLSHYSYAIVSDDEKKMILIDPSRNTQPYLAFAGEAGAQIIGIIETHPHADFVSSHQELHEVTGAVIYTSKDVHAFYPHQAFDEGQSIALGKIKLSAINTPGHSPDGISVLLEHDGKQKAVFTGDTLFIGDCGRPDLREGTGNIQSKREDLAKQMYHSLRDKMMLLHDDVLVYPPHGAGTLCGKNLSKESSSTMGREKQTNWSLQEATVEEFVQNLLADQPFIPAYFPYNVELNRKGAAPFQQSISAVALLSNPPGDLIKDADKEGWIIDVRSEGHFKEGHLPHSINLMLNGKFETWLGSIIKPGEKYYLAGENEEELQRALARTATIGYETFIAAAFVVKNGKEKEPKLDVEQFKKHPGSFTIVDVRNTSEVKDKKIFRNSISIPLAELRERVSEIPTDKPIVVHCAGGYRSAAAGSLLHAQLEGKVPVFDLGEAIGQFK